MLVPLPTWIYFALLVVLFALTASMANSSTRTLPSCLPRQRPTKRWVRIATLVAYYFSIGVLVLMHTVEIARLAQIKYGVGLLPFVYAGCAVAAVMQGTKGLWGRVGGWQAANCMLWIGGLVMAAIKVAAVGKMGTTGPYAREDGPYSTPHQINDLIILIAFYALTLSLEIGLMLQAPIRRGPKGEKVAHEGENKAMVV